MYSSKKRCAPQIERLESRQLLSSDPIIAEFQALNDSTLRDEDGDYSDWIEISNPSAEPIDLGGWHLTDAASDLRKWQFPPITLPANSEIIVFASNKDRTVGGNELHTNFRLAGGGEFLALVRPDGSTISQSFAPAFPAQHADRSYGVGPSRLVVPMVQRGSEVSTLVPIDDSLGDRWTAVEFDDQNWSRGTTAVGFERVRPAIEIVDEFDGLLGAEWTVDIPDGGASSVTVEGGQLVVDAPANQLRSNGNQRGQAPFVLRDAPADAINYEVVAHVDIPTSGTTGIVLYDAALQLPALTVEYQGRSSFRFLANGGKRIASIRDAGNPSFWMRLERDGSQRLWTAYYKLAAADDWILIGSIVDGSPELSSIADPKIGIHVSTSSTPLTARIHRFMVTAPEAPPVYAPHLGHDIELDAWGVNSSVLTRIPFTIDSDPARFQEMDMSVSFDDGFRAFLNGTEIIAQNAPLAADWNSSASAESGAVLDQLPLRTFNLDAFTDLLQTGENVLAVHVLNVGATDPDLLFDAFLAASERLEFKEQFFATPTPGEPNVAESAPAPVVDGDQGAFFGSTTFELRLANAPPNVAVFYTLDGSTPTLESNRYQRPITLSRTAMLQARAIDISGRNELLPSPIVSATFIALSPELAGRTSDIPLFVLDTLATGIPSSEATSFVPANFAVFDIDDDALRSELGSQNVEYLGRAGIRDRGSSSRNQAKINLSLELWGSEGTGQDDDVDAQIGRLPADSDWVLHAPFLFDRPMLRNQLFFEIANSVLPWAPRTQPVEVYLNRDDGVVTEADYVGTYVLIEKIKRGENRIDIARTAPEQNEVTSDEITGGYIWKIDRADPGDPGFSGGGREIQWVYPKGRQGPARPEQKATLAQEQWVIGHLNEFAETLKDPDLFDALGYSKYIDVRSWIDNHMVNLLTFNVDAFRLSAYFYKDQNGKIQYGPPWDCDRCMESADQRDDNPNQWFSEGGTDFFNGDPWFRQLFKDVNFWQAYIDRWHELRQTTWSRAGIDAMIDRVANPIAESQARNLARWPNIPSRAFSQYASGELNGTWQGELEHLRKWMHDRAAFIDANFVGPAQVTLDGEAIASAGRPLVPAGSTIEINGPPERTFDDHQLIPADVGQSATRYFIPTDNLLHDSWTRTDFDDLEWANGDFGIGFDDGDDFSDLIRTVVVPDEIAADATTLLTRTHFEIGDVSLLDDRELILRIQYDDGFVAYLNGQEVARNNLREAELSWDAGAIVRRDTDAVVVQEFDITRHRDVLTHGTNTLAIRVVNATTGSGDLLVVPELISRSVRFETKQTGTTYFTVDGTDPRAHDGTPSEGAIEAAPGHEMRVLRDLQIVARTFDTTDRGAQSNVVGSDWGALVSIDLRVDADLRVGDFDGDDRVDATDIDLLFEQLRSTHPDIAFDLSGDNIVDSDDRDELVQGVLGTTYGDVNLDRVFDSNDLVAMFEVREYEDDRVGNSTWADGDFNGDGEFSSEDLVLAFRSGGFTAVPAPRPTIASRASVAASVAATELELDKRRKNRFMS